MNRQDVDIKKVTPMMQQYLEIKKQNEDIIVFFRLGDFYEMFFEDAYLASRELELMLTGKNAGLEEKIPMCGIPYHAANSYIEKLVEKGYRIGICEQVEDPKLAKGIVKREIIQIISKGTLINDDAIPFYENNYIGSILDLTHCYLLTFSDITTGELFSKLIDHKKTTVIEEVLNYHIKELILTDKVDKGILSILKNQYHLTISVEDAKLEEEKYEYLYKGLEDFRYKEGIKHLLYYLVNTQKRDLTYMQPVSIIEDKNYLHMDIHTKRNLELTETLRLKQRNYSLLWLLDKTKTAMGSRRLKYLIENPYIEKEKIEAKYDVVDTLLKEFILKDDLVKLLDEVYDLERLSGRIAFGNANARDLLQLKTSIKVLPFINEILKKINYKEKLDTLDDIYELLEDAIYPNPPMSIKEGYLIKDGYNEELDELKKLRKGGKEFIASFEQEEKEKTGIKNLKVGYNRVFGYYIEVSKGNTSLVKEEYGYERKQTLANAERYISPILKEKEALILNAEEKIIELEYDLFIKIRDTIKGYITTLQKIAKQISEIDVLQSFATVSEENNYIRPKLTEEKETRLIENRHPVLEKVLQTDFISNDIIMGKDTNILLITGPNMAGKSTYMRQMAMSVIMAQIGCFVPCKEATIPIFDAIFTRIGATDDLVAGESTFMVEMKEANHAIISATKNSLILFDELGRGTATFDGMALAQAIIEHIHDHIGCKTFFSTHYHELTDLENNLKTLKNVHADIKEENGEVTFLHKVVDGSIDKSYGIHVAALANLPESLIKRAKQILKVYEKKEEKRDIYIQEALPIEELTEPKSKIEDKLKQVNPLEITPMEALNILYELKEEIK